MAEWRSSGELLQTGGWRSGQQTLNLLQDMAIQICRTAAFKRMQHVKKEGEEKKKAQILEDAKKEGIAHPSGAFKNGPKPSTSKTSIPLNSE